MDQKYQVVSFNNIHPVNIYVPLDMCEEVDKISERFGLNKYYSRAYIYYHWKQLSTISGRDWLTPTKESIEYVFNLELKSL